MYKKAGIVIAVILVVAGIIAISISSCRGDDLVKVNNLNETSEVVDEQSNVNQDSETDQNIKDVEQSSKVPVTTQSELPVDTTKESSVVESIDSERAGGSDTSVFESKSEEKPKEQSKTESSLSSEDQSLLEELSNYSEESSKLESKGNETSETSETSKKQDEFTNEFIEIEKDSIKYENTDKNIYGVVKGTKMFYSDNCLYTAIVILGEDGYSYNYFVPLVSYEGLETGTKLKLKVRTYFDDGVSIKQVLSVEVA